MIGLRFVPLYVDHNYTILYVYLSCKHVNMYNIHMYVHYVLAFLSGPHKWSWCFSIPKCVFFSGCDQQWRNTIATTAVLSRQRGNLPATKTRNTFWLSVPKNGSPITKSIPPSFFRCKQNITYIYIYIIFKYVYIYIVVGSKTHIVSSHQKAAMQVGKLSFLVKLRWSLGVRWSTCVYIDTHIHIYIYYSRPYAIPFIFVTHFTLWANQLKSHTSLLWVHP